MPLFLMLLLVPLAEIFLFIKVGGLIGVWPTIGIVLLTAIIGTAMLRRQGLAALRNVQTRIAAGENPGKLLADGAMILVAGVLLLTPGFLTDTIGFLLLVPGIRGWLWERLAPRLVVLAVQRGRSAPRAHPAGDTVVEGDYREVDPATERPDAHHPSQEEARSVGHDHR